MKEQEANQAPEPVISKSGQMFNDPQLAQVADSIDNL